MALTDNLEAYYKLDSAGITTDSHSSNTLTNTGSVTTTTGLINEAGSFSSGSSQKLDATISGLNSASAASMSFWFYRTATGNTICCGTSSGSGLRRWCALFFTDGVLYVDVQNSPTGGYGSVTHGLALNTWHHVVVIYDGAGSGNSGKLKCYTNNTSRTLTFNGTIPNTLSTNAQHGPFVIGARDTTYSTGNIDEVAIWSRAITASEVTELYNSGAGLAYSSFGGGGGSSTGLWYYHHQQRVVS